MRGPRTTRRSTHRVSGARISAATRAGLARLPAELSTAGFHAPQVAARLGGVAQVPQLYFPQLVLAQFLVARKDDSVPVALTAFFLGGAPLPWRILAKTCSSASLEALQEVGWVRREGREALCEIALVPFAGLYVACDIPGPRPDLVFQPDDSTAGLLTFLPLALGARRERALDLGTGSGLIALHLARNLGFGHVRALDVNPRAVRFAALNAALNGVPLEVLQADLTEGVGPWGRDLDLVTFALPWLHSAGPRLRRGPAHHAARGEQLFGAVIRKLSSVLGVAGRALLYHQALLPLGAHFTPKLLPLLERARLRASHLTLAELPVQVEFGVTRVQREAAGRPRFQHLRHIEPPSPPPDVDALDRRFTSEALLEAPPATLDACRVRAVAALEALPQGLPVPPVMSALLQRCDGSVTVAELRSSQAGANVVQLLVWLVREGKVELSPR